MKKLILLLNILLISVVFAKTTDKISERNDNIMKMQKSQVPGYYRFILGNYEITSINDGYSSMKIETYNGIDKIKILENLKKEYSNISVNGEDVRLNISVNTFLVNTGKELILIDTGGGKLLGPSMGLSKKNIELSGYKPEDIDKIIFTHLHPDHALGLYEDGKKTYPNATLTMVGPDKDGSLETTKLFANSINTMVNFTGKLTKEDWWKLASEHDIFINTTHFDNTPVSVMEAMTLGLPVVSTNVGGIPFLLSDNENALLVDDNDTKAMVESVQKLIENPEKAIFLANNARNFIEQMDWQVVKKQWADLLQ